MLKTLYADDAPPAEDGVGRAAITDPDELAACRALVLAHPMMQGQPAEKTRLFLDELIRFNRYVAGYAVMSAGELPDRIGVVLSGRCRVYDPARPDVTIGWVGPGETLGEMSHLTKRRRTVTVTAVRDVVLAEVPIVDLEAHADETGQIKAHAWLAHVAAERALGVTRSRPPGMNLTLLSPDADACRTVAEGLAGALRALGDTCEILGSADWDRPPTISELEAIEQQHDYVLFLAHGRDRRWTDRVIRQADRVLVVADAAGDPTVTPVEQLAGHARCPVALVLLHAPDITVAKGTARWLAERPGLFHLHVRRGRAGDFGRCARLATGRGRGVAFAGASSRGIGYSGMVRAFEELDFVPDVISGNSSGAMAAACLAAGYDADRVLAAYRDGLAAVRPGLTNTTLPFISLLTGARASAFCRKHLGEARLEDLLIPCVLTAVDLTQLEMVDQRTGPAWKAVRASGSLPVYYPPVCDGERVLIDGGVLENFPVRPLDPLCRDGFVVIGDLSQSPVGMTDIVPYGTQVSGWRVLLDRIWPFGRRRAWPTLPEVMFRSACLASIKNQMELGQKPGWVFVRPDTPPIGLFGASENELPRLVEDSRAHAVAVLTTSEEPAVQQAFDQKPRAN